MEIVKVSTREGRHFIPLKGWESVTNALNVYAGGYTRGAKVTTHVTADDIDKSHGSHGGMAVGLFMLGGALHAHRNPLVDELLKDAEERLKTQTDFSRHYDYDAMGTSFFKTSVDIKVLDRDQDMYGIGINAAYVGDQPERGLAEHFGITRALLSCSVEVETKPLSGNRFAFDFEPVLRKLDGVLETHKISGKEIAAAMVPKDNDRSEPAFVLQNKDGLEVRIQPGRVESRMNYSRGEKPRDTWSVRGSVFSGDLRPDYGNNDINAKATPTFLIVVPSSERDDWHGSMPIWQPDKQQTMIALTNKIAAALQ